MCALQKLAKALAAPKAAKPEGTKRRQAGVEPDQEPANKKKKVHLLPLPRSSHLDPDMSFSRILDMTPSPHPCIHSCKVM
jgi:hypothetical protein